MFRLSYNFSDPQNLFILENGFRNKLLGYNQYSRFRFITNKYIMHALPLKCLSKN